MASYYGYKPIEHEAVDSQSTYYFKLAIEKAEKANEWLLTTNKPFQDLLIHVEVLVVLSEVYPDIANLRIDQKKTKIWKDTFNNWYEKYGSKIPKKYREDFKQNADDLFEKLCKLGHSRH